MEKLAHPFSVNSVFAVILFVLCSLSCNSCDDSLCPDSCTCSWAEGVVSCSNVLQIPSFSNRTLITDLSLSPNKLSEIKKGDFSSFTNLRYLDLSNGSISTIAENAFDEIKGNIRRININRNRLKVIQGNVFKDMPKLEDLELNGNILRFLNGSIFVNLPKLNTVKFEFNNLVGVDDGVFKNVSSLETIYFLKNQLTEIPYKALQNVPSLQNLNLGFNKISNFGSSNFQWKRLTLIALDSNNIRDLTIFPYIAPNLESLNIGFNNIASLKATAWRNLSALKKLNLNGNKMTSLSEGRFTGLDNVETLLLRNMPLLESIGQRAFADLKQLRYVELTRSKLKYIHEDAFEGVNLTSLYLDYNNLTTLTQRTLPLLTLEYLSLENNSWNCDCKLKWMLNESLEYSFNSTGVKTEIQNLNCSTPFRLKGKQLKDIKASDLICGELVPSASVRSRFVTGVIVAVVCLLVMTIFALLMKFRKQIMIRARKYYMYRRFKNDAVFTVGNESVETELEDVDLM